MSAQKQQRPALKLVKTIGLNMIPGYPIVKALGSARATIMTGAHAIGELKEQVEGQTKTRRVRTWNQALAARPADALPLAKIASDCLTRKRVALAFVYVCLSYAFGGILGGDILGVYGGIVGSTMPALFVLRDEHRLWQMEVGPTRPDEPLGSVSEFLRTRGVLLRLLNPYPFR
ncbi:hypothetical protein [Paraburkholderia sp. GAS42]|uniref:hypothetical protein n=1 Tax=Paraburkholderia sp. GAS42 TaxID=3035135 RepID=UPI003D250C74